MIGKSRVNWRPDLFLSRIQFSVSFEASMPSAIPANAAIWRVALPSRLFISPAIGEPHGTAPQSARLSVLP
jgi:hypothetical protein